MVSKLDQETDITTPEIYMSLEDVSAQLRIQVF
jgi:hypothetical protein